MLNVSGALQRDDLAQGIVIIDALVRGIRCLLLSQG